MTGYITCVTERAVLLDFDHCLQQIGELSKGFRGSEVYGVSIAHPIRHIKILSVMYQTRIFMNGTSTRLYPQIHLEQATQPRQHPSHNPISAPAL